ncbi:T7SS effector LXG polymorphic toxin [Rossellomorea sp. LjRoot5]|uniref:T7SS effector LXG polymorphic toxin n=1 Tax=Rossellomorea sp. LjRoot5 TaxID=3342331 RepID=UPI003ECDF973
MKILDSQSLHNGIDELTNMLSTELEQIEKLENEIKAFTHLKDSFEGHGGKAIRSFYQGVHQLILSTYLFTIKKYEQILKNIKSAADDLEPDQTGYIQEAFLTGDLTNGLRKAENLTMDFVDEANSAISRVSDIVYAPPLEDNRFISHQQQAHKKIAHTIEDLAAFDSAQTKILDSVEHDIQIVRDFLLEVSGMFESEKLNIGSYQSSELRKTDHYQDIVALQQSNRYTRLGDIFLSPFDMLNSKMSWGDNLLAGYQTLAVLSTGVFSSKLSVHYLGNTPTLWQKLKGNYEFSVRTDPSWTSKGKHSSKMAKSILTFSRAETPSNPLLKYMHKFVKSYESPAHLYKHAAGFPKNFNKTTGAQLRNSIVGRMKTGTKEIVGNAARVKGLTTIGKRIPLVGNAISYIANFGEFTAQENAHMGRMEKFGRFAGGVGTDMMAIGAGARIGATIGSMGGPLGIVIGASVGGLVGGLASSKYGDKVKDFTGKIGKKVGEEATEAIVNVKNSVASWFN